MTEPGSSGSPLFDSKGQIIGHLHGGQSSCDFPNGYDLYGALSSDWTAPPNVNAKLSTWLNPAKLPVNSLSGYPLSVLRNRSPMQNNSTTTANESTTTTRAITTITPKPTTTTKPTANTITRRPINLLPTLLPFGRRPRVVRAKVPKSPSQERENTHISENQPHQALPLGILRNPPNLK